MVRPSDHEGLQVSSSTIKKFAALAAGAALAFSACASTTATPGAPAGSGAGSAPAAGALACPAGKLVGEGSSAQLTAIQETIAAYQKECKGKSTIEYNGTGSGAGIKQFNAGLVDFGGTDSYLKTAEADAAKTRCSSNEAWNLPMVVGPIAFTYNIDGVTNLVLSPKVLASIFQGKITTWNDPAIAALNSGAKLPSDKIAIFYRSGESGTTENASKYLKATAPDVWTPDASKSWKGVGGEGKSLTADVANAVKGTKNSLGYVEWGAALDNKLSVAAIDGGTGAVKLDATSVGKAVEAAKITGTGNDLKMDVDYTTTAAGAYPAILITYEVVCSSGLSADKTALLKDFLGYYASTKGQKNLEALGYAPLPASVQTKVAAAVSAIK